MLRLIFKVWLTIVALEGGFLILSLLGNSSFLPSFS